MIFKTFYGKPKKPEIFKHIHESPFAMTIPLILLSVLSLAFIFTFDFNPLHADGWFKDMIGYGKHNFLDMNEIKHGIHHAHDLAMILYLLVAFVGIVASIVFYYLNKVNVDKISKFLDMIGLYRLSKNKFYVDEIYNLFLYQPFMKFSKIASIVDWDYYDQKFIDSWGWITLKISKLSGNADYNILDQKIIDGTSHLINFTSKKLKKIQSGIIQNYLLGGFMCLVIIFLLIQQFN